MKTCTSYLFCFVFALASCSEHKKPATQEMVIPAKDTLIRQDSVAAAPPAVQEKLTAKSRQDLDALLQNFLAVKDVESLIDEDNGIFYIEEDAGAKPVYKQLYSKYDLLTEEQYLLYFRDHHLFPQQFYFPQDSDPCQSDQEGYYVLPVPEKNELLAPIYKMISAQNNVKPKPELLDKLTEIDASVARILMVHAKGKNDEPVVLKFYLAQKGKSVTLVAIDARPCGA